MLSVHKHKQMKENQENNRRDTQNTEQTNENDGRAGGWAGEFDERALTRACMRMSFLKKSYCVLP